MTISKSGMKSIEKSSKLTINNIEFATYILLIEARIWFLESWVKGEFGNGKWIKTKTNHKLAAKWLMEWNRVHFSRFHAHRQIKALIHLANNLQHYWSTWTRKRYRTKKPRSHWGIRSSWDSLSFSSPASTTMKPCCWTMRAQISSNSNVLPVSSWSNRILALSIMQTVCHKQSTRPTSFSFVNYADTLCANRWRWPVVVHIVNLAWTGSIRPKCNVGILPWTRNECRPTRTTSRWPPCSSAKNVAWSMQTTRHDSWKPTSVSIRVSRNFLANMSIWICCVRTWRPLFAWTNSKSISSCCFLKTHSN